ncbi:ATP-binding protein [Propionivibrio dicarboxylicus]|uniref:histidine kinase n=1 Tax=Propionivibrio dicarboxylicus TaxID=83767 RepID=A0A1G8DTA5_9RHOO|nr:ATP-binding protein [Propionivibrio dicarboxylicus]SDH60882.1 PAS domain S-box-containing protein [Propionivibrio dicarboxylicus]
MTGKSRLARLYDGWNASLRARLVTLSVVPLLVAFPMIIAVMVIVGGASFDRQLTVNVFGKVEGMRTYLDHVGARSIDYLKQQATSDRITTLLAAHFATKSHRHELAETLKSITQSEQFDFLIIGDRSGKIIASSLGSERSGTLPDTFVTRQARTGLPAWAYEVLSEQQLRALSPTLAERARIESGSTVEGRGLLINFAVHFPLSSRYPDTILFGGILVSRNSGLIDHIRDIVFPINAQIGSLSGTTSVFLDDLRVASNVRTSDGHRATGTRASGDVVRDVLVAGKTWAKHAFVVDNWQISGYEPLRDGDGKIIGMIYAGFPEAPYVREKWFLLGSITLLLALSMLVLTILHLRSAQHLTRRLRTISEAMTALRQGDHSVRVGQLGGQDEITQLGGDCDALIVTLAEQEQAQRHYQAQIIEEISLRRALFNNVRDGIVVLNDDGSVFEANQRFAEMLGYLPEEILARHAWDWEETTPEESLAALRAVTRSGATHQRKQRRRDGSRFDAEISATRIEYGENRFILCLEHDITERLRLTDELERHRDHLRELVDARTRELETALKEAKQANKAKSDFLANMSHEIRTPMNGILGMTEVLLESPISAEQRDHLQVVKASGDALLAIINDILDFSKIEAGRLELEHIPFNLPDLMQSLIARQQQPAKAKGLALQLRLADDLPPTVIGDPIRLGQIMTNLLSNAIKFTAQGSVSVEVRRDGADDGPHARLRFSVTDTGIGIAPEKRQGIFDAFVQSDSSVTRRFGGTGLGLAISRELVARMGGTLDLDSELNRGSCFHFSVDCPIPQSNDAPTTPASTPAPANTGSGTGAAPVATSTARWNILVAEDNKINQRLISAMLSRSAHTVTLVGTGNEVLAQLAKAHFDVILMDLQMPELDGLETTQRIRAEEAASGKHQPIIALTADALVGDKERCIAAGMDGYVAKPFSRQELLQTLANVIDAAKTATREDAGAYKA